MIYNENYCVLHGQYRWNEHGVCINPSLIEVFKSERVLVLIKFAEGPNGWDYGNEFECRSSGNYSSPQITFAYLNKEEAITQALIWALEWMECQALPGAAAANAIRVYSEKNGLDLYAEYAPSGTQLTLDLSTEETNSQKKRAKEVAV